MAVAKKLLPRAIDRNRFRRIVREAWRAGREDSARTLCDPVTSASSATADTLAPNEEERTRRTVFVRLMKTEPTWKRMPDGPLKRLWREEIDRLFLEFGARLRTERR